MGGDIRKSFDRYTVSSHSFCVQVMPSFEEAYSRKADGIFILSRNIPSSVSLSISESRDLYLSNIAEANLHCVAFLLQAIKNFVALVVSGGYGVSQ